MSTHFLRVAAIYAIVLLLVAVVFYFSLLGIWQEKIFDTFFIKKTASPQVIIFAIDNESIGKLGQWPWQRDTYASVIGKLQTARIIGVDVNFSEVSDTVKDSALASAISNSKIPVVLPIQINTVTGEQVRPLPQFGSSSLLGQVNIINEDGVVRRVDNLISGIPSFASVLVRQGQEDLPIPPAMRIDYAGPEKTFLTLPISSLLENKIPERIYEGKIVLIGATAPDLHDFAGTPVGQLPGVEIHANIIGTLLGQKFYGELPFWLSLLSIFLANLLAVGIIVKIKRLPVTILCLVGSLVAINIAAMLLFSVKIIFPVLYVNVGFIITVIILIIYQYLFESKEKKIIHESFKYYLAPDVINQIIQDPSKLKLGGERKKITVLFSDIRGFTSLSETLTPEQLTHILNEYLTEMTDIVMAQKGLVDKYIGDAVMAFWGAPLPNATQAENAVQAAIRMIQELNKLNAHWKETGTTQELHIGIGLNTGEVVVGNFGSKARFNYTVLGDEVNLAARLEGLNKPYGTSIIITEATKKEIEHNPKFAFRQLDTIVVKGKKEPKTIYELMTEEKSPELLQHFQAGRKYYRAGEWDKAIIEFSFGAESDGPSKVFLQRCQEFKKNPPTDWKGVYEFTSK